MPITFFGKAGKRTERTYRPSVTVRFSEGEFLRFKLTASGAEARFAFECEDDVERISATSFQNHPTDVYRWELGVGKREEPDRSEDVYGVGMLFTTAVKYTFRAEHLREDETRIALLVDVDYESTAPEDKYNEVLTVFEI